jgi:hypothetical protein
MYSPKIDETLIPTLYLMAKEKQIPITRLVNGMIRSALEEKGHSIEAMSQEKEH